MRLDTSTEEGAAWAIDHGHHVSFEDPGDSSVIDLCTDCAHGQGVAEVADADHPPCDDDYYTCAYCGARLEDAYDL